MNEHPDPAEIVASFQRAAAAADKLAAELGRAYPRSRWQRILDWLPYRFERLKWALEDWLAARSGT